MNHNSLPPFNIFCAGTQMTGYAWMSAKCLFESCPIEKRESLKISIHLVGLTRREKTIARNVFQGMPYVEIVEDILLLDERKTGFDRFRVDLFQGKSRVLAKKIGRRCPRLKPLSELIGGPDQRSSLVF